MACEMPVNLISTEAPQFFSESLELGAIVIVSNVVIGGFSEEG